jgi:hypothetical protein
VSTRDSTADVFDVLHRAQELARLAANGDDTTFISRAPGMLCVLAETLAVVTAAHRDHDGHCVIDGQSHPCHTRQLLENHLIRRN